ncbi:hypothetical protein ACFE04_028921 [Oxalis oulophora]
MEKYALIQLNFFFLLIVIALSMFESAYLPESPYLIRIVNNLTNSEQLDIKLKDKSSGFETTLPLKKFGQSFEFQIRWDATPTVEFSCDLWYPVRFCSVAALKTLDEQEGIVIQECSSSSSCSSSVVSDKHDEVSQGASMRDKWKKLNSKDLGISTSMITKPTRVVLNGLKKKGYEVYLVGGCVRDLVLKRTPKDFDIITSAQLREVVRAFSRCEIVGRRFPICHVHIENVIVEVSSFTTHGRKFFGDLSSESKNPVDCDEKDYIRWKNCLQRDFTINGLMFDPYAKIVYDYTGGMQDINKAKVQTVGPPSTSFQEDCGEFLLRILYYKNDARILRGIRIAARLGFRFSRETAHCIKHNSSSILRLDKQRLLMEMNYMFAYGSAEASLRLLWKFGLLDAAYFVQNGFRRRDKRSNMLLSLFSNLDKLLAPDRPCHNSLWVGILAFHKALSYQPRNPVVVAAFSLAVHNGGNLSEAVNIAMSINKQHDSSFHELSEPCNMDAKELRTEVEDLAVSVKGALSEMTDEYLVSKAMAEYPKAQSSDVVFIPLLLYLKACRIFECVKGGGTVTEKLGRKINYESLATGQLYEVRDVFARIVFDTVYPLHRTYESSSSP